jgi:hypothetical protein
MEREHIIDETCRIRTVTTSDRGGQDKARKVRAVGWGEDGSNFNHAPNIAKVQRTLRFSTTRDRTTTFDTL